MLVDAGCECVIYASEFRAVRCGARDKIIQ